MKPTHISSNSEKPSGPRPPPAPDRLQGGTQLPSQTAPQTGKCRPQKPAAANFQHPSRSEPADLSALPDPIRCPPQAVKTASGGTKGHCALRLFLLSVLLRIGHGGVLSAALAAEHLQVVASPGRMQVDVVLLIRHRRRADGCGNPQSLHRVPCSRTTGQVGGVGDAVVVGHSQAS